MAPSILIVGATGNTGASLVRVLPGLIAQVPTLKDHEIIALTRDAQGSVAQQLSKLPGVNVIEKNWTYIDSEWLQSHNVERLYIASHNLATHFTDESLFFTAVLGAGVTYAVRLSTTHSNVGPASSVFYGRNHWAIENLLEQPEFDSLQWTSLQPNVFTKFLESPAIAWLQEHRSSGTQNPLKLLCDEKLGVAAIDSDEVGIIAAHLLASADPSRYSRQKYILAGPSDLNGRQVVDLVEKYAETKVNDVVFRDVSWTSGLEAMGYPKYLIPSLSTAPRSSYDGRASLEQSPTSPDILKLYAPRNSAVDSLEATLRSIQQT